MATMETKFDIERLIKQKHCQTAGWWLIMSKKNYWVICEPAIACLI